MIKLTKLVPAMSLFVERFDAPDGKTRSAFGSPMGEPPVQFPFTGQSALTAPVQLCVAASRPAEGSHARAIQIRCWDVPLNCLKKGKLSPPRRPLPQE